MEYVRRFGTWLEAMASNPRTLGAMLAVLAAILLAIDQGIEWYISRAMLGLIVKNIVTAQGLLYMPSLHAEAIAAAVGVFVLITLAAHAGITMNTDAIADYAMSRLRNRPEVGGIIRHIIVPFFSSDLLAGFITFLAPPLFEAAFSPYIPQVVPWVLGPLYKLMSTLTFLLSMMLVGALRAGIRQVSQQEEMAVLLFNVWATGAYYVYKGLAAHAVSFPAAAYIMTTNIVPVAIIGGMSVYGVTAVNQAFGLYVNTMQSGYRALALQLFFHFTVSCIVTLWCAEAGVGVGVYLHTFEAAHTLPLLGWVKSPSSALTTSSWLLDVIVLGVQFAATVFLVTNLVVVAAWFSDRGNIMQVRVKWQHAKIIRVEQLPPPGGANRERVIENMGVLARRLRDFWKDPMVLLTRMETSWRDIVRGGAGALQARTETNRVFDETSLLSSSMSHRIRVVFDIPLHRTAEAIVLFPRLTLALRAMYNPSRYAMGGRQMLERVSRVYARATNTPVEKDVVKAETDVVTIHPGMTSVRVTATVTASGALLLPIVRAVNNVLRGIFSHNLLDIPAAIASAVANLAAERDNALLQDVQALLRGYRVLIRVARDEVKVPAQLLPSLTDADWLRHAKATAVSLFKGAKLPSLELPLVRFENGTFRFEPGSLLRAGSISWPKTMTLDGIVTGLQNSSLQNFRLQVEQWRTIGIRGLPDTPANQRVLLHLLDRMHEFGLVLSALQQSLQKRRQDLTDAREAHTHDADDMIHDEEVENVHLPVSAAPAVAPPLVAVADKDRVNVLANEPPHNLLLQGLVLLLDIEEDGDILFAAGTQAEVAAVQAAAEVIVPAARALQPAAASGSPAGTPPQAARPGVRAARGNATPASTLRGDEMVAMQALAQSAVANAHAQGALPAADAAALNMAAEQKRFKTASRDCMLALLGVVGRASIETIVKRARAHGVMSYMDAMRGHMRGTGAATVEADADAHGWRRDRGIFDQIGAMEMAVLAATALQCGVQLATMWGTVDPLPDVATVARPDVADEQQTEASRQAEQMHPTNIRQTTTAQPPPPPVVPEPTPALSRIPDLPPPEPAAPVTRIVHDPNTRVIVPLPRTPSQPQQVTNSATTSALSTESTPSGQTAPAPVALFFPHTLQPERQDDGSTRTRIELPADAPTSRVDALQLLRRFVRMHKSLSMNECMPMALKLQRLFGMLGAGVPRPDDAGVIARAAELRAAHTPALDEVAIDFTVYAQISQFIAAAKSCTQSSSEAALVPLIASLEAAGGGAPAMMQELTGAVTGGGLAHLRPAPPPISPGIRMHGRPSGGAALIAEVTTVLKSRAARASPASPDANRRESSSVSVPSVDALSYSSSKERISPHVAVGSPADASALPPADADADASTMADAACAAAPAEVAGATTELMESSTDELARQEAREIAEREALEAAQRAAGEQAERDAAAHAVHATSWMRSRPELPGLPWDVDSGWGNSAPTNAILAGLERNGRLEAVRALINDREQILGCAQVVVDAAAGLGHTPTNAFAVHTVSQAVESRIEDGQGREDAIPAFLVADSEVYGDEEALAHCMLQSSSARGTLLALFPLPGLESIGDADADEIDRGMPKWWPYRVCFVGTPYTQEDCALLQRAMEVTACMHALEKKLDTMASCMKQVESTFALLPTPHHLVNSGKPPTEREKDDGLACLLPVRPQDVIDGLLAADRACFPANFVASERTERFKRAMGIARGDTSHLDAIVDAAVRVAVTVPDASATSLPPRIILPLHHVCAALYSSRNRMWRSLMRASVTPIYCAAFQVFQILQSAQEWSASPKRAGMDALLRQMEAIVQYVPACARMTATTLAVPCAAAVAGSTAPSAPRAWSCHVLTKFERVKSSISLVSAGPGLDEALRFDSFELNAAAGVATFALHWRTEMEAAVMNQRLECVRALATNMHGMRQGMEQQMRLLLQNADISIPVPVPVPVDAAASAAPPIRVIAAPHAGEPSLQAQLAAQAAQREARARVAAAAAAETDPTPMADIPAPSAPPADA